MNGLKRFETKWGHGYTLDGKRVKGVTTLINGGVPKPFLVDWSARTVAEWVADNRDRVEQLWDDGRAPMVAFLKSVHRQQRDDAAARGTHVHELGEALVHGREVEVPDYIKDHVEHYARFLDAFQVEPVQTEFIVGSRKWQYAGTGDLIADVKGHGRMLLDLKTSKGVYAETSLQLAAYRYAEFTGVEGDESPVPEVETCGVVHVTAGGADLYPMRADDQVFRAFQHVAYVARLNKDPWKGEAVAWPDEETAA